MIIHKVVPAPRASSSRSIPISALSLVCGCPSSALCISESHKTLHAIICDILFPCEINVATLDGQAGNTTNRFVVPPQKKCVGMRQEQEREQDRGNGTIMLQKTIWEKETLLKALKFFKCCKVFKGTFSQVIKKSYDFVKCCAVWLCGSCKI